MRKKSEPLSFEELFQQFVQGADGMKNQNPKIANKFHDQMHAAYKILKDSEEGRQKILGLFNHENPFVRLCAAAHGLQWEPEEAKRVLVAIRDGQGPGSFSAEITLKEFEKGALSFDF